MVLPHSPQPERDATQTGTAVHAYLEALHSMPRGAALDLVPAEYRDLCAAIPLAELPSIGMEVEVPLAYDIDRGTGCMLLGGRGRRDYSMARDSQICGTVDVLGPLDEHTIYIGDYKTGRPCTPAARNGHLLTAALAALGACHASRARLELIYIWEGKIWRDSATVDAWDLLAHERALLRMDAAIRALSERPVVAGDVVLGPHCTYCPALAHCPGQRALATRAGDGSLAATVESWCGIIRAEDAQIVYAQWQQLRVLSRRVGEIVTAWALEHGDIPIGEWQVFGPHEVRGRETLDGDAVHRVVAERHGPEVADRCVSRTASKAGLTRGLAEVEGASVRGVLEQVRAEGGARRGQSRIECREHATKAQDAPGCDEGIPEPPGGAPALVGAGGPPTAPGDAPRHDPPKRTD
jgi:hypothetical protein